MTSKITGNVQGTVYIIKFSAPMGNPAKAKGQCQTYVGWCKEGEEERRLNEHGRGMGAWLTAHVAASGRSMEIVALLPGTRADERAIKNRGNTPKYIQQLERQGKLLINPIKWENSAVATAIARKNLMKRMEEKRGLMRAAENHARNLPK